VARDAFRRWLRRYRRAQGGGLLVETVLLLSVFGMLGTMTAGAVQTSYLTKRVVETKATAENMIRNQLENLFQQEYLRPTQTAAGCSPSPPTGYYCPISPPPGYEGFSVTAQSLVYINTDADPDTVYDVNDVTLVRLTVTHEGKVVRVFESIRAKR